jgi:predicted PurR-regulated permease PerM
MERDDQSVAERSAAASAFRIGLVVLAIIVLGRLVLRLHDTIGLILLAGTLAIATNPLQRAIRRRIGSGASYALTALITFALIVAIAAVLWNDLAQQSERLAALLTDRIDDLRPGTLPQRLASLTRADDSIAAVFERFPTTVVAGEDSATGVGSKVVNLLVTIVLAAFLQAGAGGVFDWIVARWPRDDRAEVRDAIGDMVRRAGGLTRRALGLAVAASILATVISLGLGIPGGIVLGCWAGAWLVVPVVGAVVGLVPVVLVAWASSPGAGIAMSIAAIALAVAVRMARRAYMDPVLVIPPTGWVLAIGIGTIIAGPGGVVVMVLIVALVMARLTLAQGFSRPQRSSDDLRSRLFEVRGSSVVVLPSSRAVIETIAAAMAVVVVAMALGSVVRAIVWVVVASMIAVALDRPSSFIERHSRLSRRHAVAAVISIGTALVGIIVLLGALSASSTSSEFSSELPTVVRELEDSPLIGDWLRDREAAVWLDTQLQDLPQRLASAGDVADWLPAVGNRVIDLLWTLLLAAALLVDGPRLAAAARRRVPAGQRRQAVRLSTVSLEAVSGYLGGAMVVASINASVVLVVAIALGLTLAPVLAAWGFIWNFVPQIGGFMGGFPLVVLALTAGPFQALIAGVVYVTYQFVENHVIQPKIIGEAIDVPAWVTLLAALCGAAMAGLLGAVVLTPLVGVIHLAIRAGRSEDFPGRVSETVGAERVEVAMPGVDPAAV